MFSIEATFQKHLPDFYTKWPLVSKMLIRFLQWLWVEKRLQEIESKIDATNNYERLSQGLSLSGMVFNIDESSLANIPKEGPLVIVANHPTGIIDGFSLMHIVSQIRPDVRLLSSSYLGEFLGLPELIIEVNNVKSSIAKSSLKDIHQHLSSGGAIIAFPAGEAARVRKGRVQEPEWHQGFLRFANAANAAVLPVSLKGRNSKLFYLIGMICKKLSMLLIVRESFYQQGRTISINFNSLISAEKVKQNLNSRTFIDSIRDKCIQ